MGAGQEGDGDLDIFSGSLEGRFKVFVNDGSANFTLTDVALGPAGSLLIVDDLNGDGFPDVVTASGTTALVTLNDGSGGFVSTTSYTVGDQPRHAVVADLNEDGDKDVAMVTVNIFGCHSCDPGVGGSVWIMPGNGDGTFDTPYQVETYRNNFTIGAGDFD